MKNLETMLIPAIIQDSKSKDILMMGYMNSEALKKTIKGPNVWFYSRSKKRLWEKGETSKNYLEVGSATPLIKFEKEIKKYYPDFYLVLKL